MNYKLALCLASLLILPAAGHTLSLVAATPVAPLQKNFACPGAAPVEARDFQVLAVRHWSRGIVAVYRGLCPTESQTSGTPVTVQPVLSYRIVQRQGREWHAGKSGSYAGRGAQANNLSSKSERLIDYGVDRTPTKSRDRYTVFYGQVFSPKVAAVEVTFNNGKTLRDPVLDGMFALVAANATGICDVRVFGSDNQILQRYELVSPQSQPAPTGNTCQPVSGQL
jgi:hypothetical protein